MDSTVHKRTEPYRLFNRVAKHYDRIGRVLHPLWREIVRLAGVESGDKLLDVCTGTGGVAYLSALEGAKVVGVDMSEAMLNVARSKASHIQGSNVKIPQFYQMDARELGFRDKSFDHVVMSMSLHEMWDNERMKVLKEMARIAKKRVVVGDYWIPEGGLKRWITLGVISFEFLESPGFRSYIVNDLVCEFQSAGINVEDQAWVGWTGRRQQTTQRAARGLFRAVKGRVDS